MKTRKPFDIKYIMMGYNLMQTVYNMFIILKVRMNKLKMSKWTRETSYASSVKILIGVYDDMISMSTPTRSIFIKL